MHISLWNQLFNSVLIPWKQFATQLSPPHGAWISIRADKMIALYSVHISPLCIVLQMVDLNTVITATTQRCLTQSLFTPFSACNLPLCTHRGRHGWSAVAEDINGIADWYITAFMASLLYHCIGFILIFFYKYKCTFWIYQQFFKHLWVPDCDPVSWESDIRCSTGF